MLRIEFDNKKFYSSMNIENFEEKLHAMSRYNKDFKFGEEHLLSGAKVFHFFGKNKDTHFVMKVYILKDNNFSDITNLLKEKEVI